MVSQKLLQAIPLRTSYYKLIKDMRTIGGRGRELHDLVQPMFRKQTSESLCLLLPCFCPFLEISEFDPQHRRLQGIKPAVDPKHVIIVLFSAAVNAQQAKPLRTGRVIRRHQSAISHTAKVFGGEKAETTHHSESPHE